MQTPKPKHRKQRAIALSTVLTIALTFILQLFIPITAHAQEAERTISINLCTTYKNDIEDDSTYDMGLDIEISGTGKFVAVTAIIDTTDSYAVDLLFKSDKQFSYKKSYINSDFVEENLGIDNGYCYMRNFGGVLLPSDSYIMSSIGPNIKYFSSTAEYEAFRTEFFNEEVTKDDYKEPTFDESTATYDVDLDLASLGAKSKSAWTISKGEDGWTLTTPSTAGVSIYWKPKQTVVNSYVKICFNGKYYKKLLDIKYVDGAISLSGEGASSTVKYDGIDRNSNEIFFLYDDILADCIEQNNYDGGYSFVIDDIQMQCYAEIDGVMKKSRVYKIDFDMIRESGSTDTVYNDASNVTYGTIDSTFGNYTTSYDDTEFIADIEADKPIYEYDEIETNTFTNFFKWFYEMLQSITNSLQQFPQLLSTVFGFLPKEIITIIGLSLGAVVILRFLGR